MAVNNTLHASIANGASLSAEIPVGQRRLVAIQTPADIDGTAFTFQGSADGATWTDMYDDAGTEVSVTMAASRYIPVDPAVFAGCDRLKIRTGTTGAPTLQVGDTTVSLITVPILG